MAEPTQFSFELTEVATALVKHQGIHSGKWTLSFELVFTAGLFGQSPADLRPGAGVQFQRLSLVRSAEPPQAPYLVVDAAEVNPEEHGTAPVRKRKKVL